LISLSKDELFQSNEGKEGVISIKWEGYSIQMGGVIPFKWGGLFHSNGGDYFIQMGGVISFKHSNGGRYFIQMKSFISFKWGGLFNSNERKKRERGYFIQIESANDYIQIILLSKLLSFVKECMIDRLKIIVQEDKAFSHAFKHQKLVFMNVDVLRLLWSSNSSDLNMIESC
jgi:hypothetical protein